jgi:hypothetical protein
MKTEETLIILNNQVTNSTYCYGKFHYYVNKSLPLYDILRQYNPVQFLHTISLALQIMASFNICRAQFCIQFLRSFHSTCLY